MDNWIQAIYDATGIPLKEEDLSLGFLEGQWWLALHGSPVMPVGADPAPHKALPTEIRAALTQGMIRRLSKTIPRVRHLIQALGGSLAQDVDIQVVYTETFSCPSLGKESVERCWPHFVLRLSVGDFDVEIDLNPYVPEAPYDLDEVHRQADVILQLARAHSGPQSCT